MHSEDKPVLRVVALLDGRPGHEKQTRGIIEALKGFVQVETVEIVVPPLTPWVFLSQLAQLFLPGKGGSDPRIVDADILLGTGSRTHLPLLLFKKTYAVPAFICMSPFSLIRDRFDLCFVPEHDGITEQQNIVQTAGAPNCSRNKRLHQENRGLILLGGVDPKSHHWDSEHIVSMVRQIIEETGDNHWTLSSSPRTPPSTVELLRKVADEFSNVTFYNYSETPPGWIEEQYDMNSVVWVTSDSISMIYEALTAGCKVGIIPMRWKRKNCKFKRNEAFLCEKGLVVSFSSWLQGDATWRNNVELNEAHRCAERILQIWRPRS